MGRYRYVAVVAVAVMASLAALPEGAQAAGSRSAAAEAGVGAQPAACTHPGAAHLGHCYLSVEPASAPPLAGAQAVTCAVDEATGYTPCNLQNAYGLTKLAKTGGNGVTVAVVDANDDPNAASDLAFYRSHFGLPACTVKSGCFTKVNQSGQTSPLPTPDPNQAQEIALDLEMVSVSCPHCHLLLVEANSNGFGDLGTAENEAITLGARVVSNSWGTGEFNGETGWDGDWDHPGVAITFSSGDGAYQGGVQYPSASPYVTSVGGTELTPTKVGRTWAEGAWVTAGPNPPTQGSGSGCSGYEPKPMWQKDTGCARRTTADVSAVAANVLSYDTYQGSGWYFSFGTSVSSPLVAGIYGLAANPTSITIPASAAYSAPATSLFDIVTGQTGTCIPTYLCKARKGYDGPTGMGSPHGIGAFQIAATPPPAVTGVSRSGTPSNPTITISGTNLGNFPPIGTPETCQAGDTGDIYGASGLWFSDSTTGWTAGQSGDCIGLVVSSWSGTQVTFTFGNQYGNYPPIGTGDSFAVDVQGAGFSGTLN